VRGDAKKSEGKWEGPWVAVRGTEWGYEEGLLLLLQRNNTPIQERDDLPIPTVWQPPLNGICEDENPLLQKRKSQGDRVALDSSSDLGYT